MFLYRVDHETLFSENDKFIEEIGVFLDMFGDLSIFENSFSFVVSNSEKKIDEIKAHI